MAAGSSRPCNGVLPGIVPGESKVRKCEGSGRQRNWNGRPGPIYGPVPQHRPEDVEPAPGQRKHRLSMGFTFSAFTVVVGP